MIFRKKKKFTASRHNNTDIIEKNSPFPFIEGYRSLRTNLSFTTFSGEIKTILVTSSMPGEGKSSVSINLARSLSMAGKKVLLIDGDLRSPSIHKYLRVRREVQNGFSSVLASKMPVNQAIYFLPSLEFSVMLSGPIPPNASELLSRENTREIIEDLQSNYDTVIIDSPPSGVVTDAVLLANSVDGVLFVVKQNYANRDIVKSTLKAFNASSAKMLGVVLNDYNSSHDRQHRGYSYVYNYNYGPEIHND